MAVKLIPTRQVEDLWRDVAPLLGMVMTRPDSRHTLHGVRSELNSGDMQLFIAHDDDEITAAAVTKHMTYSKGDWLCVVLCGGHGLDQWGPEGIQAIEAWAKQCGCMGVEIIGRAGWAMALPGYERTASVIQRTLQ